MVSERRSSEVPSGSAASSHRPVSRRGFRRGDRPSLSPSEKCELVSEVGGSRPPCGLSRLAPDSAGRKMAHCSSCGDAGNLHHPQTGPVPQQPQLAARRGLKGPPVHDSLSSSAWSLFLVSRVTGVWERPNRAWGQPRRDLQGPRRWSGALAGGGAPHPRWEVCAHLGGGSEQQTTDTSLSGPWRQVSRPEALEGQWHGMPHSVSPKAIHLEVLRQVSGRDGGLSLVPASNVHRRSLTPFCQHPPREDCGYPNVAC